VRVLAAEVHGAQLRLAVESRSRTLRSECDLEVHTGVDDDVERVLEFLNLVGVANDFDFSLVVRLKDTMSLNDLPDALFLLGESSVFGWDLRLVFDLEFLCVVFEHFNVAVLELLFVGLNEGPSRCCTQHDHERNLVALHFDV
jgi:hypothetical protein